MRPKEVVDRIERECTVCGHTTCEVYRTEWVDCVPKGKWRTERMRREDILICTGCNSQWWWIWDREFRIIWFHFREGNPFDKSLASSNHIVDKIGWSK